MIVAVSFWANLSHFPYHSKGIRQDQSSFKIEPPYRIDGTTGQLQCWHTTQIMKFVIWRVSETHFQTTCSLRPTHQLTFRRVKKKKPVSITILWFANFFLSWNKAMFRTCTTAILFANHNIGESSLIRFVYNKYLPTQSIRDILGGFLPQLIYLPQWQRSLKVQI